MSASPEIKPVVLCDRRDCREHAAVTAYTINGNVDKRLCTSHAREALQVHVVKMQAFIDRKTKRPLVRVVLEPVA